jgi:hypothetical protein
LKEYWDQILEATSFVSFSSPHELFSKSLLLLMQESKGTLFASEWTTLETSIHCSNGSDDMKSSQHAPDKRSDAPMTLETIIAVGLFGWLALSMTLMGLGIW